VSPAAVLWRAAAALAAPLLPLHLGRRARRGKEILARLEERRGFGAARPAGRLLWLHAASVGETLSIIPLLEALAEQAPELELLVTTGTVTGAEMLGRRLPDALGGRLRHRFLPLDVPGWVARFLDGWRPDAVALVESELWPNLIAAIAARGIPLALVNARFTAHSARRWRLAPRLGRRLASAFSLVTAQTEGDAARLRALGARAVRVPGNLKDAAPPLPADAAAVAALRAAIGDRPVWLAASTRAGEEPIIAAAHRLAETAVPGLLTILVPRHPERGAAIAAVLPHPSPPRRALGALPTPESAFYVADTLGELGLFYRLAGVAVIGGTLLPHGGQNPREAARLGCPILVGPHGFNFEAPIARLLAAGGARAVAPDAAGLAAGVVDVLNIPDQAAEMARSAAVALADEAGLPGRIAGWLLDLLPPAAAARGSLGQVPAGAGQGVAE